MRYLTHLTAVGLAAALVVAGASGCFSEHVPTESSGIDIQAVCSAGTVPANMVVIRNFSFNPSTVTVQSGESVTWVNCETTAGLGHTSTSDNGVWASGLIVPFVSFSRTFAQSGSFPYHCEPHPSMTATVVVQ